MKIYPNSHFLGWSFIIGDDGDEYDKKSGFAIHFHCILLPTYIRLNVITGKRVMGWGLSTQSWNWKKDTNGNFYS